MNEITEKNITNARDQLKMVKPADFDVDSEWYYDGVRLPSHFMRKADGFDRLKKLEEDVEKAMDRRNKWHVRLGSFLRAENTAGRKAGAVLDAITLFLPFGQKIDNARHAVSVLLERKNKPPMKKILKRAFSTDGGSWLKVRDEDGKIDTTALAASVIRAAVIIGVLYVAEVAGVLDQFLAIVGLN